jgi:tRNA (guanine-N7-)-methyltransferase
MKRKLQRFAEVAEFPHVLQPRMSYPPVDQSIKGKWHKEFFKNDHPIVLELGCGRGEYTVELAEKYPQKNFIGIDIKGARLWRGSKTAHENKMTHVGFIRTEIQWIEHFFAPGEVSEIWVTFPDPHLRESKQQKRLTSNRFLKKYAAIIANGGIIHLKTDNEPLYDFTLETVRAHNYTIHASTNDLYQSPLLNDELGIKTTYEKIFTDKGFKICYVKFSIS